MSEAGTKGVARAERRQLLVRSAIEEFGRRGYAGASVTGIAGGAGVSKAMVYHLFTSKDGLSSACLEEVGPRLVSAVADAQSATDPARRALDTLTAIFTALADNRYAWAVIYDPTLPPETPAAEAAAGYRRQLGSLGTVGTGEVLSTAGVGDRLDQELLDRLWQSAVATTVYWWQGHDELTAADMTQRCARLLGVIIARS